MTLEQVKQFSAQAEMETMLSSLPFTFWAIFIPINIAMIVWLIWKTIGKVRQGKKKDLEGEIAGFVFIFAATIVFGWVLSEMPAPGSTAQYKASQNEWTEEYVKPYFATLPKQTEEIKEIKRDYLLEESVQQNLFEREYAHPVKITTVSGKIIQGWANLHPLEAGQKESVEYVELTEDLIYGEKGFKSYTHPEKHFKKGQYHIIIYTDKAVFN